MLGRVKTVSGNYAKVCASSKELCDGQQHCGACGVFIKKQRDQKEKIIVAKNIIKAKVGDAVNFEVEFGGILKASFVLFLCPVLLFIVVCCTLNTVISEPLSFICGIVSCVVFYFVCRYFLKDKTYYAINSLKKED